MTDNTNLSDFEQAESFKLQANVCFQEQNFEKAIELYTKAIELNDNSPIYYSNRSFAYLKREYFGAALDDATKAIELDPKYVKAYYRRATAFMSLGKFKEALKSFEFVTKMKPSDPDAKLKFNECRKIVRKLAFEKSIAVDDCKRSIADSINLDIMTIEDNYDGPALKDGKITLDFMKELMFHYKDQKKLHKKYAYKILLDIKQLLMTLPTLIDVSIEDGQKFTVCGDIHGQYYDLLNIFDLNGLPSSTNPYLFNGDFVDRGSFSVECIFTLFGFKLLYPNHFFLARGNHESATMNEMYGFGGEVRSKYSPEMADFFTEIFNWLPLVHCINEKILVMHGGLSSNKNVTLQDIREIYRNRQPPEEGLMCDLLWSDPSPQKGISSSKRGVGCQFGPDVTRKFLYDNHLDYIIRSHEVKSQGYEVEHGGKCITVFSAPNYCDTIGNLGAFITMYGPDLEPNFVTYQAVDHPKVQAMAYSKAPFLKFL